MEFVDLNAAREFSPEHHIHKSLTATVHSDISIACWEPGPTSPIHCHPGADEIYHVVEGNGRFSSPSPGTRRPRGRDRRDRRWTG
jgi:quercetin dioxygenase-like cupin family protein